jgi:amino acid adenylation domain-containing protein
MRSNPYIDSDPPFVGFAGADVDQTIAQRFEQQAERHPERVAIKTPTQTVTYDALNRKANQIAHAILCFVAARQEPVALMFGAGAPMIAAGFAVLKAGRAYAPLDAQLPKTKARQVVASLGSPVILTDGKNLAAAREVAGRRRDVLNIDALDPSLSPENLNLAVEPDSIAYINFTSGSTGEPKGVVWNHRSELFGIGVKTHALRIAAGDRVSLLRANNVGAVRDMHLALLNGAAVATVDLQESGLASLARWLREEEITVFSCVATIFRQAVASAKSAADFSTVRLVHIGGEPIFRSDVGLYKKYFPDRCRFVNRYSISETQAVSYFFIDKKTEIPEDRVPVGYALEGSAVSILDDRGHEIAAGETGEIAVSSRYLALGYWRQPELTRQRFFPHGKNPGYRTYRTGDLGYRLADGCLVHVGRKDLQMKIRGHRVDVMAIENALHQIRCVKRAAVVGEGTARGEWRLIAYIVPRAAAPNVQALRAQIKQRLPAPMVPAKFVFLARLPVTAGGKVDRRALPAAPAPRRNFDPTAGEPRSALERLLIEIWRDALGVDGLGIHADFTEAGGDSLLGARIVARLREYFPCAVALRHLFETPTVAALARWLIDREPEAGQSERIATVVLQVEHMSDAEILRAVEDRGGRQTDG